MSASKDSSPENKPQAPVLTPPGVIDHANEPTVVPSKPQPSKHKLSQQDLSTDNLLKDVPVMNYEGRAVPSLAGIPLLAKLGQGGMGAVYYGIKPMLKQEVAVKILPKQLAQGDAGLVDRFMREAQIAAQVESANLIRVTDVGEQAGLYYLVMEYVRGLSGSACIQYMQVSGLLGLDEATALDICIPATNGLNAAHYEGVVHRDVKPDNIIIPLKKRSSILDLPLAKLADLGLARGEDGSHQSLTGTNAAMGTPGYMAPEQAMNARKAGKPADVFSMGATLYALMTGRPPFRGETATATMFMTVQQPHTPLSTVCPKVSKATADLVDRCLSKEPEKRPADAAALYDELKACRAGLGQEAEAESQKTITILQKTIDALEIAKPVFTPPPSSPVPLESVPMAQHLMTPRPSGANAGPISDSAAAGNMANAGGSKTIWIVAAVAAIALIAGVLLFGFNKNSDQAFALALQSGERALSESRWDDAEKSFQEALKHRSSDGTALKGIVEAQVGRTKGSGGRARLSGAAGGGKTELMVVFSPDKESWMRWAAAEFAKTPEGSNIALQLVPRNFGEVMQEILNDERKPHVWTPGSSLYTSLFKKRWRQKFNNSPILSETSLAASPLVLVMFEDRYKVFIKKYQAYNLRTMHEALLEEKWAKLGGPAEWGDFRIAIRHPLADLSGMATALITMHRVHESADALTAEDVKSPEMKSWFGEIVKASKLPASGPHGVTDMVQKGPSVCDGMVTYESLVLEALSGKPNYSNLRIDYPKFNFWNEHPYYVLDAPWSTAETKDAAAAFQRFLLDETAQKKLLDFGLRPASPKVSMRDPNSLWERFKNIGFGVEIQSAVTTPNLEVLNALIDEFKPSAPQE